MEIKVILELRGLEVLADAINNLAGVKRDTKNVSQQTITSIQKPQEPQNSIINDYGQPIQSQQNVQTKIPTTYTAQEYTQEQLARAMAVIVDKYGIEKVQKIMADFGVRSLAQLSKDKYVQLATILREMGANI